MPAARDIVSALRATAIWLLVMSVFLGPAAIGAKACGVLCPCDEPQVADHDDHDVEPCADEEAPHEHDGEEPGEACFDDCSGCAPGVTLATAAVLVVAAPASSPEPALALSDAPTTGVCTGVFRPPRSLV